jgi:hypothetical protein
MRDAAAGLGVRAGVNLGPVRLVKDLNGQVNIIGDGINVAQRVMSFARPGQLLVSRSFYEVVSCLSRDYASLFRHEGSRTDKHVRDHEVYSVGGTPTVRRLSDTNPPGHQGLRHWVRGIGPLGLRRSALVVAPLVFIALIGSGFAARSAFEKPVPPPSPVAAKPAPAPVPAPKPAMAEEKPAPVAEKPAPVAEKPAPVVQKPAPKKQVVASADKKPERPKTAKPAAGSAGRVELVVTPWGEVLVDGKSRGISPPLKVVELSPGAHTIEIRNSTFRPHVQKVQVKAGEAVRIRHSFR